MHKMSKAKENCELLCRDFGVTPQEHLTDNGSAFTSSGFTQHLAKFSQVICFAGAGAHHANGVAE